MRLRRSCGVYREGALAKSGALCRLAFLTLEADFAIFGGLG